MPVMLLRDMDAAGGLANGTRLNGTALQASCRTARSPRLLVCGLCLPISLGLIDVHYYLYLISLGKMGTVPGCTVLYLSTSVKRFLY